MLSRAVKRGVSPMAVRYFAAGKEVKEVASWSTVPFVKEDMETVMQEVPDFNFYEIGGDLEVNQFKDVTMAQNILPDGFKQGEGATGKYNFSKLENGLRVVSVDNGGENATVGLYVQAGSRFESVAEIGVSHMIELSAFRSTAHLSHLRTVKTLETLGVEANCAATKEHIGYTAETLREFVPVVVPLLIGNVLFPRFLPWETTASHALVSQSRGNRDADVDGTVSALLLEAAYHGNTLGNSIHVKDSSVGNFTPETMRNYMLKHFSPQRMVMVGVNASHDELTKWAMRAFVDYNAVSHQKRDEPKAKYTGGSKAVEANSPNVHVALGFECSGLGGSDLMATAVLQQILGAATGAVAPGTGAHTRLAGCLKSNPIESAVSFLEPFSDSGVFGIYVSAAAARGGDLPKIIQAEVAKLSKLEAGELDRAKNALKTALGESLASGTTLAEDIAVQVMTTGKATNAAETMAAIDKVTEADVTGAAKKIFASTPSMVAYGNLAAAPLYADVAKLFGK